MMKPEVPLTRLPGKSWSTVQAATAVGPLVTIGGMTCATSVVVFCEKARVGIIATIARSNNERRIILERFICERLMVGFQLYVTIHLTCFRPNDEPGTFNDPFAPRLLIAVFCCGTILTHPKYVPGATPPTSKTNEAENAFVPAVPDSGV